MSLKTKAIDVLHSQALAKVVATGALNNGKVGKANASVECLNQGGAERNMLSGVRLEKVLKARAAMAAGGPWVSIEALADAMLVSARRKHGSAGAM